MQIFLKTNGIISVIGVPSHVNDQVQKLALGEKISFQINPSLLEFDLVLLFDFNDFEQLGKLRKAFEEIHKLGGFKAMAFDHHELEERSITHGKNAFIDTKSVSTTELLLKNLDQANQGFAGPVKRSAFYSDMFNPEANFLNCLGILEDTGHFVVGDSKCFDSFARSLRLSKRKYSEVLAYSKHVVPVDERIAFLKAAGRSEIIKINESIIVTSILSFYQGPAAMKLLDFGAHISIVCGKEKDGLTTLSGRVDSEFKDKKKFNLMKHLLVPLQKKFGGEAGGHSGAAQWKGKAEPKRVLNECVAILKKQL
jgi:nanoRNase/pAp phosphatase (c-di-AMP/oligoRNAs hydrolase)